MNLVGFGLTLHDSSIAAYKDGRFLYRKAERQFNSKHAHGDVEWAKSVLKDWDIDNCESMWADWLKGSNPQKIKDGNKLDHHYCHALSAADKQDVNYVQDSYSLAPADTPSQQQMYSGFLKVANRQVLRLDQMGLPTLLQVLLRSNYFDHMTDLRQFVMENTLDRDIRVFFEEVLDQHGHKDFSLFAQLIDFPGKVMSLQSYGKPNLNKVENWHKLDRFRNRVVFSEAAHTDVDNLNHDYISTLHKFCEQLVLDFAPDIPFHYSGGVAQNVVWNRAMLDAGKLPTVYPWAYDGGCSIGALNYLLDKHNIERYAGWEQDDEAPQEEPSLYTIIEVAQLLAEGKVVGWYQGNGEVGPRALGNRSILYDPSRKDAEFKVNNIKQREWWRPFGASVLESKASQFFDLPESRHMLFNSNVLYSGIPGVTHVDGTCRHQTVPDNDTPFQWLLTYFELETGIPVLLNTSLNVKGKPLCSTIEQAVQLFKNTELDALCVGDTLYKK
jgi:predicted NodU family carbamoyl transferase